MRFLRIFSLSLLSVLLIGCGSDKEEMSDAQRDAFRQELIDKALNDDVRKAGEAFLNENRLKPNVFETPSGLQYRIIEAGAGEKPRVDQVVEVSYEGRRVDGYVFDKTAEGSVSKFPLKQVIRGWREGVSMMQPGAEWEFYVPADLAYGATSPSVDIPANSTLIFKVKLLRVLDATDEE